MPDTPLEQESHLSFVLHRLHSLSGVFPIAVFMLAELWVHAKAVSSPEAHREALETVAPLHALWLVIVPLSFHAGYGVLLAVRPKYNVVRYPLSRNWFYVLQRVSGLVAVAFIALHAALVWWPRERGAIAASELHAALVRLLSATYWQVPWMAFVYILGLAACTLHLACGLWTFSIRWGLAVSKRARGRSGAIAVLIGLAMFAIGARTVLYLATGWRLGGTRDASGPTLCPAVPP